MLQRVKLYVLQDRMIEIPGLGRRKVQFSTQEMPWALKNGTLVKKTDSDLGDTHQDGSLAIVVGSWGDGETLPSVGEVAKWYSVEWEDFPGIPVNILARQILKADPA